MSLLSAAGLAAGCGGTPEGDADGQGGAGGADGPATGGATSDGGEVPPIRVVEHGRVDKIDLLFVIDNSTSMADKQTVLSAAIPRLVQRLVEPECVTRAGGGEVLEESREPSVVVDGRLGCSNANKELEFEPIEDIHLGVITSSLGGHGSTACADSNRNDNDKGYLIPLAPAAAGAGARGAIPDPTSKGFLTWHPSAEGVPAPEVEGDVERLVGNFQAQIVAAGDVGCGFEAPLEAWYRFLVDPSPPDGFVLDGARATSTGVDPAVLAQRAAFLRPDSLVGVVVVSDENDCSAMEGGDYYPLAGYGWYLTRVGDVSGPYNLPVATPACAENPNDACCFSCLLSETPSYCDDASQIAACEVEGEKVRHAPEDDRANLRCFENRRRFGVDLLYPVSRYVNGLTQSAIVDSQTGETVHNQLLMGIDGHSPRGAGMVFLGGIVGVPWQDIATTETLEVADRLRYLTADQLADKSVTVGDEQVDRWAIILGEPGLHAALPECEGSSDVRCGAEPVAPLDPFMRESIGSRSGSNPISGDAVADSSSWNAINGHEYDNSVPHAADGLPRNDDLQYSCIFPLAPFGGVKEACVPGQASCDCGDEGTVNGKGRPVCRAGAGQAIGTTQHWGKAYPAPRVLQTVRDVGDAGMLASICPKIVDDTNADYGYNPAVDTIIDRLGGRLGERCLTYPLDVDAQGKVTCTLVEALAPSDGTLDCGKAGRSPLDTDVSVRVIEQLPALTGCEGADCAAYSLCAVTQHLPDTESGSACLESPETSGSQAPGFCYVDPTAGWGEDEMVAHCSSKQQRLLRLVGSGLPQAGAVTLVACLQ
ncbi:MAG TPA: hypothetical protein VLC09_04035 [Polyangiaceae bacterium]|nr:hypothetical protein [Polyangiaceae bacterium]